MATEPDAQGFVENDWIGQTVAIGDEVRLHITGPCPRCVMTTLPQGDLPKDAGILHTAAQHNQANVGVHADVVEGGTLRRGDPVAGRLIERASSAAVRSLPSSVGGTGLEPVTPSLSSWCSPN